MQFILFVKPIPLRFEDTQVDTP